MTRRDVLLPLALFCTCLSQCVHEAEWDLPESVASSKYIDYGTWADTSVVCMDRKLRQWDQFIEQSAQFLEVAPPSGRLRYVWVPKKFDAPGRWGCPGDAIGCYQDPDSGPIVFVRPPELLHELVHAVETPALGRAHIVLEEGMAELLSTATNTLAGLDNFAEDFLSLVESGGESSIIGEQDRLAKHFVGSIVNRYGIARYRDFRAALPHDGRIDEFVSTYKAIFGEDLFAALEEMSLQPVAGLQPLAGCAEDPSLETLSWTEPGLLEAPVDGTCGDPHFYGFGMDGSSYGFYKQFAVDVEIEGTYELRVEGPSDDAGSPLVELKSCHGTKFALMRADPEGLGYGPLGPGRHSLLVFYPPRTEPVGEADVSLNLAYTP